MKTFNVASRSAKQAHHTKGMLSTSPYILFPISPQTPPSCANHGHDNPINNSSNPNSLTNQVSARGRKLQPWTIGHIRRHLGQNIRGVFLRISARDSHLRAKFDICICEEWLKENNERFCGMKVGIVEGAKLQMMYAGSPSQL